MSIEERVSDESRRTFVIGALYAAPLILTLKAEPAFASYGSGAMETTKEGSSVRRAVARSQFTKGHATASSKKQSKGIFGSLLKLLRLSK